MGRMPKWKEALPKRLLMKYEPVRKPGEGMRLPDFVHETGHEFFRLDKPMPGGYVKCIGPESDHEYDDLRSICPRCGLTAQAITALSTLPPCREVTWWFCDPLGHWGRLGGDLPVTEHEDGTITVRGTIENAGPYVDVWCGTLERGVWTAIEAEEQMEL